MTSERSLGVTDSATTHTGTAQAGDPGVIGAKDLTLRRIRLYHVYHVAKPLYHFAMATWYTQECWNLGVFSGSAGRVPRVPRERDLSYGETRHNNAEPLNPRLTIVGSDARITHSSNDFARGHASIPGFRLGATALNLLNPFPATGSVSAPARSADLNPRTTMGVPA